MNIGQYKNSENLSTKVYEYMAAGIPVVMNDFEFAHNCPFAPILEVGMARSAQQIEESRAKMQRLGRKLNTLFTGLTGLSFVCAVVATIVAVMRILSGALFDSSGIVPIIATTDRKSVV